MLVKSGLQMSVDKTKADEVLTTINELTLDGWTGSFGNAGGERSRPSLL